MIRLRYDLYKQYSWGKMRNCNIPDQTHSTFVEQEGSSITTVYVFPSSMSFQVLYPSYPTALHPLNRFAKCVCPHPKSKAMLNPVISSKMTQSLKSSIRKARVCFHSSLDKTCRLSFDVSLSVGNLGSYSGASLRANNATLNLEVYQERLQPN